MINNHCKKPITKHRILISEKINKRKVVNISGITLTNSETSLLSKGLNFSPTSTEVKKQIIYKDIDNLKRSLSLKVLFTKDEKDTVPENENLQIYKSNILDKIIRQQNKNPFQPAHENSVQAYADAIKDEVKNTKLIHPKPNLTDREQIALQ